MRPLLVVFAFACAALGMACSDDLTPASFVIKSRPIGAHISVVGEPERSEPRPEETVRAQWWFVDPAGQQPLSWLFVTCPLAPTFFGAPRCAGEPQIPAGAVQLEPALATPDFEIVAPSLEELDGAEELLMLGFVCVDGEVNLDIDMDEGFPQICVDPERQSHLIALIMPVDFDDTPNRHPAFGELTFDGAPWTFSPVAETPLVGCADVEGLPQVTVTEGGDLNIITLAAAEGSRETFAALEGDPPEEVERVEDLQISNLLDFGEIERTFSFVDDTTPRPELDYAPPARADIDETGSLARFYFVMRDLRGGIARADRAVCLRR